MNRDRISAPNGFFLVPNAKHSVCQPELLRMTTKSDDNDVDNDDAYDDGYDDDDDDDDESFNVWACCLSYDAK
jgi:hypothetical protein